MPTFDSGAIAFATLGGLLLGLATSLNYAIRGRVTGMSGIAYDLVSLNKSQLPNRFAIVGGMLFISGLFYLIWGNGSYDGFSPFGPDGQIAAYTNLYGFFVGGLLVGFGAKLSNGCTSGHGLCGLPRFSIRSLVAVGTFLMAAIAISTTMKWTKFGFIEQETKEDRMFHVDHQISAIVVTVVGFVLFLIGTVLGIRGNTTTKPFTIILDQMLVFVVGLIFAVGLMVSGMSRRSNILSFLQLTPQWNPALLFVLGSGVLVNTIVFTIFRRRGTSLNGNQVFDPQNSVIDWKLVVGALCFGLGWGIGGLCPGPFFVLWSVFTGEVQLLWGSGLVVGMLVAAKVGEVKKKEEKLLHSN